MHKWIERTNLFGFGNKLSLPLYSEEKEEGTK